MKDVGGAVLAGSSPPFLGRERAAVDVDVGPERRSPRYHETCLALESVKDSSAAVLEPNLFTPETGPQSRGRMNRAPHHTRCQHCAASVPHVTTVNACSRMNLNRAHNCERCHSCSRLFTVGHGCSHPKPVRNHVID